ncbi:MAG: SixA phosphatase family protein [Brevundimonas sp.]|jgi:broad specificity phosphatase PhoE
MKRMFLAAMAAALMVVGPAAAQTVIIVRHAEKVADGSANPDLTEAGQARALRLSQVLADAGVTHVLSTSYTRTRETGRPTAEAAGLTVTELSGGTVAPFVEAVRAGSPDDVFLIVGHSNTVDKIAQALGDPHPETLTDCDYDRLVVLTLDDDQARVVRGRYGVATTPCPSPVG